MKKSKGKDTKTNAMRILDKNKIAYKEHLYECDGFMDGVSIAQKLGQPTERVFKTLVAEGKSKQYYVYMLPVAEELNLKAAAAAVGEKSVEMIHVKDITKVTGYVRGGCSPLGMKKQYKTTFHITAQDIPQIIVSAGKIGYQIDLKPVDLIRLTNGQCADIVKGQ